MSMLKKMGITNCPHCKVEFDDRGFCGCEQPFNLNAVPQAKIDGIARTIFPRIKAHVEGFNSISVNNRLRKEVSEIR